MWEKGLSNADVIAGREEVLNELSEELADYIRNRLERKDKAQQGICPDCGHRAHARVSCFESDCCGCGQ